LAGICRFEDGGEFGMKDANACREQSEYCLRKAEKETRPDDKERWLWLSREWLKLAEDPRRRAAEASIDEDITADLARPALKMIGD